MNFTVYPQCRTHGMTLCHMAFMSANRPLRRNRYLLIYYSHSWGNSHCGLLNMVGSPQSARKEHSRVDHDNQQLGNGRHTNDDDLGRVGSIPEAEVLAITFYPEDQDVD